MTRLKPLDLPCSVPGCERPQWARQVCALHCNRLNLTGEVGSAEPLRDHSSGPCSVAGCKSEKLWRGFCRKHHRKWKKYGDPLHERQRAPDGSGRINTQGYREIWVAVGVRRAEHRWIMEQSIGRELQRNETVHHRNGDRLDNRLENLELWSSAQPAGQRVTDKICWAVELLERYPDFVDSDSRQRITAALQR